MRLSALDLEMPPAIARVLADGTGVPVAQVESMGLDHARLGIPSRFELFEARFDLLLDSVRDGVAMPEVCTECLAEDKVCYARRAWYFAISTCCPRHQRLLEEGCLKCRAITRMAQGGKGRPFQRKDCTIKVRDQTGMPNRALETHEVGLS